MASSLVIGDCVFKSRLMLGTGKFSSNELMSDTLSASGTEIVTVALRRADLSGQADPFANILDFIDREKYLILPNTSGAMDAEEAVRLGRWSKESSSTSSLVLRLMHRLPSLQVSEKRLLILFLPKYLLLLWHHHWSLQVVSLSHD